MDVRDFAILTHLLSRPFDSFERVGRAVGVTGAAVRARVARLEQEGFLSAFHCIPAPEPLGRVARGHVFVGVDGSVEEVLRSDAVVTAIEYADGALGVITYDRPGDPPVPADLVRALGEPQLTASIRLTRMDPRRAVLGPLDWRVMRALVRDPTAAVSALATETGLTRRTVARRREALLAAGALRPMPAVVEARARGLAIAHVFVIADSLAAAGRAAAAAPGAFVLAELTDPPGVSFASVAPTVGEIVEVEQAVRRVEGVLDVAKLTPLRIVVACERVATWIDAQLEFWSRGSPSDRAD